MNGNISNGGLVVKWQDDVVFALPNEWFLNADDEYIYYSNSADENRLYRKHGGAEKGKMILNKPCAGITIKDDGIYYVNEDDKKVYRCSLEGKNSTLCSKLETYGFAVLDDGTVYTNKGARRIYAYEETVFFADGDNENNLFALTKVNVKSNEIEVFLNITPSYINVHGGNVYYTDRNQNNKIYRLDGTGARMPIYGASAECLHVIGDWLYFLCEKKWKRLSLLNFGDAENV